MALGKGFAPLFAAGLIFVLPLSHSQAASADDRVWQDFMGAAVNAHRRGDLEGAERHLKAALSETKRLGADDQRLAETHAALGTVYFDQGRGADARASLERAQAIFERALEPQETRLAGNLNALGLVYAQLAEDEQAIAAYRRAAEIYELALGDDHPTLSRVLENLAGLHLQAARYDQAKAIFPRILAIQEKTLGVSHPDLVPLLDSYALSLRMTDDAAGAEALETRASKILAGTAPK